VLPGVTHDHLGGAPQAEAYLRESLKISMGDRAQARETMRGPTSRELYTKTGDWPTAREHLANCAVALAAGSRPVRQALTLRLLGELARHEGISSPR